jgi:hypothetical protein
VVPSPGGIDSNKLLLSAFIAGVPKNPLICLSSTSGSLIPHDPGRNANASGFAYCGISYTSAIPFPVVPPFPDTCAV